MGRQNEEGEKVYSPRNMLFTIIVALSADFVKQKGKLA